MSNNGEAGGEWRAVLDGLLGNPAPISSQTQRTSADMDMVIQRIRNSRWRRSAVDPETASDIELKVFEALVHQRSIEFSIPFGGYKSWRLRSHPLPDWAEVFCLSYLRDYFTQVSEVAPSGVDAYFSYCSGVMGVVSNMPDRWQRQYLEKFSELLKYFSTEQVRFQLSDIAQRYDSRQEVMTELRENCETLSRTWLMSENQGNRCKRISSAERNFVVQGVEDLSGLTPEELSARVERSAVLCEALDSLVLRRKFNKYSSKIQLVFVRGPTLSLHVGSTSTSANHFWVGSGVLEQSRRGRVLPRILSDVALADRRRGREALELDTSTWSEALDLESLSTCLLLGPDG